MRRALNPSQLTSIDSMERGEREPMSNHPSVDTEYRESTFYDSTDGKLLTIDSHPNSPGIILHTVETLETEYVTPEQWPTIKRRLTRVSESVENDRWRCCHVHT